MRRLLVPVLLLLLCALPVLGVVDLLAPAADHVTNLTALSFEYYASMPAMSGCTLQLNQTPFADPDAQSNAMNDVAVANMVPGNYFWNVTCANATSAETSVMRRLTIDTQAPTVVIFTPVNGSTQQHLPVDFIAADDRATQLGCDIAWNGQVIESVQVTANIHYAKNYTVAPGNGTLQITCRDTAGNAAAQQRALTVRPLLYLRMSVERQSYGIGEPVRVTVDTLAGANLTVDVCPNQQGFVQCTSALIDAAQSPQTITLPYMNRTGQYLVEAIARYGDQVRTNRTNYTIENTIGLAIGKSGTPRLNSTVDLTASVSGGIAPYRLVWKLSNGTVLADTASVSVRYLSPGTYNETVTAYDAANNSRNATISLVIEPVYSVAVRAIDNQTGGVIPGAQIELGGIEETTGTDGLAYFEVDAGRHDLFASAPGYRFVVQEHHINGSRTIDVVLVREQSANPVVAVLSPGEGSAVEMPVRISYAATHPQPLTCTLFLGTDDGWFVGNGSERVSDDLPKEFVRQYPAGAHRIRIECADAQGRTGASPTVSFTVSAGTAVQAAVADDGETALQQDLDTLEGIISGLAGYGQKEKEAIEILGVEKTLRSAKRTLQQHIRDLDSLRYRTDIDDAAKAAERTRLIASARKLVDGLPRTVEVLDDKTYVRYVEEDSIDEVVQELAGLAGFDAPAKTLRKRLIEDQQKFTISSRLMQVQYSYANGSTAASTVVRRSFTYAEGLGPEYAIIEIVPKDIAKDASELTLLSKAEVLKKDPVLRFERADAITYIVPRKVDFTRMETIKTVLARPYAGETGLITGLAVFSGGDIAGLGWPIVVLIALLAFAYAVYYFDLIRQATYVIYRFRKNEQVHYLRVLIRDAEDQLAANDYGKAEMLYREIRMTYDSLPAIAKNDLYEEIIDLVRKMDAYYFNLVMLELDEHLKAGDMEAAVRSYEKLTGTFERLDPERQNQLISAVVAMGKRLGLEVPA